MTDRLTVGVIGDFNPGNKTHQATNAALESAASALSLQLQIHWIPTPSLLDGAAENVLARHDALWLSPGSPYSSEEGALAGVEFARRRDWPFTAT